MVVLSFDDSIEEKPYTDSSELACRHYDHVLKCSVKGINLLTALVEVNRMPLRCAVEFVKKNLWVTNEKSGKQKCKGSKTKNEMFREMVKYFAYKCRFDYVLADS